MKEVDKEGFREMYFKHGREEAGWGREYWEHFFENAPKTPLSYLIEEPESPAHKRMMIVSDFEAMEYRLFFLTEDSEEIFFGR